MKAVLISIQPYYVFLIIARAMGWNIPRQKTVEVRKDFPRSPDWNKRTIIYCTKSRQSFKRIPKEFQPLMVPLLGKVIGEFVCDWVREIKHPYRTESKTWAAMYVGAWTTKEGGNHCLTYKELYQYLGGGDGFGWHISDLKIYDQPKELGEFKVKGQCKDYLNCDIDKCEYYDIGRGYLDGSTYEEDSCLIEYGYKPLFSAPRSWRYVGYSYE